jgi:CRISPR-associated protein Cas2
MRTVYLVCYDVANDKRLRRTYKKMRGFGTPLQYSVFRCELSPTERQGMKEALWEILNWSEDRVMVVDLGPAGRRGDKCVEFWGEPRVAPPSRRAVIV